MPAEKQKSFAKKESARGGCSWYGDRDRGRDTVRGKGVAQVKTNSRVKASTTIEKEVEPVEARMMGPKLKPSSRTPNALYQVICAHIIKRKGGISSFLTPNISEIP